MHNLQTFEIKNRFTSDVIFSGEYESFKSCVENAVKKGVSLAGANLENADLRYAYLRYANLRYAYLRYANLMNADLRYANLRNVLLLNTIGNMRQIKSLQLETYTVVYTDTVLQIGCENHSIENWKTFTNEQILKMGGKEALRFWNKYKEMIFNIIELSPASPTKIN